MVEHKMLTGKVCSCGASLKTEKESLDHIDKLFKRVEKGEITLNIKIHKGD